MGVGLVILGERWAVHVRVVSSSRGRASSLIKLGDKASDAHGQGQPLHGPIVRSQPLVDVSAGLGGLESESAMLGEPFPLACGEYRVNGDLGAGRLCGELIRRAPAASAAHADQMLALLAAQVTDLACRLEVRAGDSFGSAFLVRPLVGVGHPVLPRNCDSPGVQPGGEACGTASWVC